MKKNLLFTVLATLCVYSTKLSAQVALPYYSGFDNAAQKAGWTEYKKAATTFSHWGYATAGSFSAPSCVGHDYSPSTGITLTDNWFVSPPFSIPGGGTLDSIRYKCSGFSVPVTGDTVGVYLLNGSQDPALATSKTLLFDCRGADYVNDYTYHLKTNLALAATSGNSYIAIRYRNTDCSSKWLTVSFDNVAIRSNSGLGLQSLNGDKELITVSPNPTNGKFIVQGKNITAIDVYDVTGKKVLSVSDESKFSTKEMDVSVFPKGIYFLKITDEGNVVSRKLILE